MTWLTIIGGVVVGVGLIVAMVAVVLRLPPSKGGLEPHSMGGDWWQNDASGSDGSGDGGGH